MGGAIKIEDYMKAFSLDLFLPASTLISFNLSTFEFTLGVCLLLGAYRWFTTLFTCLFMAVMTLLTFYLALFNPVADCGCFGDAIILTNWETFFKNVVLMAASILVFTHSKSLFRFYSLKTIWFVVFFTYTFGLGFAWMNYNHLPLVDFRPYKVGANIPEMMSIPDGAPVDEYSYSFTYEKDGVQKFFSLDDAPTEDTTWTFIDSKTELIQKGYTPLVESFQLFDATDTDISEQILADTADVFLLIMPDASIANEERIDRIGDLYDYTVEAGLRFYAVIGSSDESFQVWTDYTGAEYPYLKADKVFLKTIIRSNPGLIQLRKGSIINKWHNNDLPQVEELTQKKSNDKLVTAYLLLFFIPLSIVWLYDLIRYRRRYMLAPKD